MKNLTCSFFGHRKIDITENLKQNVKHVVENLIVNHNVTTFLFGSRSEFCKASYVERNQAMINNSNYCVFYYDENYQPKI